MTEWNGIKVGELYMHERGLDSHGVLLALSIGKPRRKLGILGADVTFLWRGSPFRMRMCEGYEHKFVPLN